MTASPAPHLDSAELRELLRAVDPAARLVSPRLLRRVIRRDRKLTGLDLRVPHHHCYVIGRDALLDLVTPEELGVGPGDTLPPTVLLLVQPEPAQLAALPRDAVLIDYWRLLFHARIHKATAERFAAHPFTKGALRQRIHHIGQAVFDEIHDVLLQERLLLPPHDDQAAYEEFLALYLELKYFAAAQVPCYFPSVANFGDIDRVLVQDVDAAALFAATRPAGAPDPPVFSASRDEPKGTAPADRVGVGSPPSGASSLTVRADRAGAAGNVVRAALIRAHLDEKIARAELDRLVDRLRPALDLDDAEAGEWRKTLPALLPRAAQGIWPPEARLLYDVQKVCVDHERPVYDPDLVEWAYALFREPLARPLPHQPFVLAVKHLRGAVKLLPALRVDAAVRQSLAALLHGALHRAEHRLRDRFRPLLHHVLHEVGLRPQNFAERISADQLVEELLDRIVERGFVKLGDLRDAVARNQLKLPDVAGPGELVRGDALLCANRALAARAAGVYRRAEVYLRALQRASALAFGTRPGRWLTLFVALPFGLAFGTVVLVQEILHLAHLPIHAGPAALSVTTGALGVFFLLLIHTDAFRRRLLRGLHATGKAVRVALIDLPVAFWRSPWVRQLRESWLLLLFLRYVLKPTPVAILVAGTLWLSGVAASDAVAGGGLALVAASLLFNSRIGRNLEERTTDWVVRKWEYVQDLLPGLVRLVIDISRTFLEALDRVLYAVDEWRRFRGGQGRLALLTKTVFGFAWFLASYVVRLCIVVFIEPWVNPLKHFPAVTMAGKFLLPITLPLIKPFAEELMFLGTLLAYSLSFVLLKALPGAAGFLVWELKENWRLYRANRPATLRPANIGHHGESVLRLLKPGLHSGTLPKLYTRLRKAVRKGRPSRRPRAELHHIENAVHHFAARELLAFVNASRVWMAGPVHVTAVSTGSKRLRIALACPTQGESSLELTLEEHSGWLLARVSRPGWLSQLSGDDAAVLTLALTGFYHRVGVDLVHEQVTALLGPGCPHYDVAGEQLAVWPGADDEAEVVYELRDEPVLAPRVVGGHPAAVLPKLERERLLFSETPVAWADWVAAWERDQAGAPAPGPLVPGVRLLPAAPALAGPP